jgi:hypothetical protein
MGTIDDLTVKAQADLERAVQGKTRDAVALEHAAQAYAELVYGRLKDALVLTRVFVTTPYGELPPTVQRFAMKLADSAGAASLVNGETLVLCLVGTSGMEAAWNDRQQSAGHVAIPLVSAAFIAAIPMMSRLLKELGLGLEWIDARDTGIIARTLGNSGGVFHVRDAASEVDAQGRKVIAAQDFVAKYGVKSVLGIGGAFMGTSCFVVNITFCREEVSRSRAEALLPLINRLKVSTLELATRRRIFAA